MTSSLDVSNYSALHYNDNISNNIINICEPLFNNFKITFFGYARFFTDGTYLDLCTSLPWQKHYMEHFATQPFINNHIKGIYQNQTLYTLWNNDLNEPREKIFQHFIRDSCAFDIWHGLSIYKHFPCSIEAWHFATTKENYQITNFYLNHMDVLEHFIFYFRDKSSNIIDATDLKKLIVLKDRSSFKENDETSLSEKNLARYLHQTELKKYYFRTPVGIIYLSRREVECVLYLSMGRTIKEIANTIKISPRTVECYIDNAKKKLNCSSRIQLIEAFSKFMKKPTKFLL